MAVPDRDPITCHVLDTTTGRPAANISVKLTCCGFPGVIFGCETNADGRIAQWQLVYDADGVYPGTAGQRVHKEINGLISQRAATDATADCPVGSTMWKLEFDTGSYYGAANTFFPKVELSFLVKEGEHFHVPLLLGPYSFTTYRGS